MSDPRLIATVHCCCCGRKDSFNDMGELAQALNYSRAYVGLQNGGGALCTSCYQMVWSDPEYAATRQRLEQEDVDAVNASIERLRKDFGFGGGVVELH